ncbi:hypothetical protein EPN87_00615 [archaeon]|nr:MAG: hypothetical protein EPN87_00615 [archaeon]
MKRIPSLSRKTYVTNDGKRLLKVYNSPIPVMFLDFMRTVLSLVILQPQIDFINVRTRINNEITSRKKIKMAASKILKYSFEEKSIIESFVDGVSADKYLESTNDVIIAGKIGKFTGGLHKQGMALVDNRPKNYIINDKITRVDLEMFREGASEFDKMCDLLSFVESFDDMRIRQAFLKGHNKSCSCGYNAYIGLLCKLFLKTAKHWDD